MDRQRLDLLYQEVHVYSVDTQYCTIIRRFLFCVALICGVDRWFLVPSEISMTFDKLPDGKNSSSVSIQDIVTLENKYKSCFKAICIIC